MKKKIIDGDNQTIIGYFDESESEKIKEQYENDGRWEDVGFDIDGDLTLFEEL